MQGQLFTRDFVERGITETPTWRETAPAALGKFLTRDIMTGYLRAFLSGDPDSRIAISE